MRSAIAPCATGISAPPTIAIIITPEPSPVRGPSSATPRVKILGNMIELKNPTRMMLYMAVCPVVSMETATSAAAHTAQMPSSSPVVGASRPPRATVPIPRMAATTATRPNNGRAWTRIETITHQKATDRSKTHIRRLCTAQQRRPKKSTDHRTAPVKRDETGRHLVCQAANFRLCEVVHQKASDGNLVADVDKNADRAE